MGLEWDDGFLGQKSRGAGKTWLTLSHPSDRKEKSSHCFLHTGDSLLRVSPEGSRAQSFIAGVHVGLELLFYGLSAQGLTSPMGVMAMGQVNSQSCGEMSKVRPRLGYLNGR